MRKKEQPVLSEPEAKPSARKPRRLLPDFSKEAKGFLESHIARAFGAPVPAPIESLPNHPTAEPMKVSALIQAQRTEGNYYVQQAIEQLEKRHPRPPVDPKAAVQKTVGEEGKPKPAPPKADEKKQPAKPDETKPQAAKIEHAQAAAAKPPDVAGKQPSDKAGLKPAAPGAAAVPSPEAATPPKSLPGVIRAGAAKAGAAGPTATPETGGGGGGADAISAWRSRVHGRIAGIKPAAMKAPDSSGIKNAADQSAAKRDQAAKGLADDAKKAVTPPKPPQDLPPVPDDRSKLALFWFDLACNGKLDPQSLPDVAAGKTPLGHTPLRWTEGPARPAEPKTSLPPTGSDGQQPLQQEKPQDKAKEKPQDKTQTAAEKAPEKKTPADAGAVPKHEPAPPGEAPERPKIDIGSVVASLIVDEKKYADQIVDEAWSQAFGGAGEDVKNTFGKDLRTEGLGIVDGELRRVAEAAGIEKDALEKKIESQRKDLDGIAAIHSVAETTAAEDARVKLDKSSKDYVAAVDQMRDWMERSAIERQNLAKGNADADKIREDRDRLLEDVNRKLGIANVNFESARKSLKDALAAAAGRQIRAYQVAAGEDEAQLLKDAGDDEQKKKAAPEAYRPTAYWLDEQKTAVAKALELKQVAVDVQADGLVSTLKHYADDARDAIRDYAAKRLGYERNWFQKLFDYLADWVHQSKIESEAWARKRADENKTAVDKDASFLDTEVEKMRAMTVEERQKELLRLDNEQAIIIVTFLKSEGKDPVGALAAGLMFRISNQQRPELVTKLEKEVLACSDFAIVDRVAVGRNKDFNGQAETKSYSLHDAFEGPGTNEEQVFKTLGGLSAIEAHDVELCYKKRFGESLKERLNDELNDWATFTSHDIDRANAMMAGDDAMAVAVQLDQAMHGTTLGLGLTTDSETIFKALRNKSPSQILAIKKAYREKYGRELAPELDDQLNHWYEKGTHDVDRARALIASDTVRADAIGVDRNMQGWFGLGIRANRQGAEDIYAQQNAELEQEADAKHWDSAKLKRERQKRSQGLEQAFDEYAKQTGRDIPRRPGQSAYYAALEDAFSGSDLRLITGLHEADVAKVSAARIDIEHHSFFYASDKVINQALQDPYTEAFKDRKRDLDLEITEEMEADRKKAFAPGGDREAYYRKWSADNIRKWRKEAEERAGKEGRVTGAQNFDRLEHEYNTQYKGKITILGALTGTPSLGFREDVLHDTQFTQREKAAKLIEQKGYLSDIQEIRYAIKGPGTDEDKARAAMKGKNKEEMQSFRERWAKDPENKKLGITDNLDQWILGDFSGRDYEEMRLNLTYGESPDDPQDQLDKAKELAAFERRPTLASAVFGFGRHELDLMDQDLAGLEAKVNKLKELKEHPDDPHFWEKYSDLKAEVDVRESVVQSAVASHRRTVDVMADTVTQVIGAIVTAIIVVGSIVLDVVTAGGATALTPVEAGLIAALGTVLTMEAKAAIKGTSAYGWEEAAQDAAIGAVDALTAGVSTRFQPAARFFKGGLLARLAEGKGLSKLVGNFAIHAAEGGVLAAPGAIVGNAINKENYQRGDALLNILEGSALQVGLSVAVSGGLGTLSSAAHSALKDRALIKARTDLEFQESLFERYQAGNPGKTRADFLEHLDYLIATQTTNGFQDPRLQELLRSRVLEHIDPAQRAAFKDVPVHVLPEDQFNAATRSSSGNAVTVFEEGRPAVVLKAGTDLSQLGEEGIHLIQSIDPATAAKVAKLDESVLRVWDHLDLDTQLDLYKSKLELEIDAQERRIGALEGYQARAEDPAAIGKQIEKMEATIENLEKRYQEVMSLTPEDKLDIETGAAPKPQYLDQPARLFAKEPTLLKGAGAAEISLEEPSERPVTGEGRREIQPSEGKPATPSEPTRTEVAPTAEAQQKEALNIQKDTPAEPVAAEALAVEMPTPPPVPGPEQTKAAELQKRMSELQDERAQLRSKLQEMRPRLRDLEATVTAETRKVQDLQEQMAKVDPEERAKLRDAQTEALRRKKPAVQEYNALFESGRQLEQEINRLDTEIEKVKREQFRGSKPWRSINLEDPKTEELHKGIYGELETATIMEAAGCKPKGDALHPEDIVFREDFESAFDKWKGRQDIDHLFEPLDQTQWSTYAVESKATGKPLASDTTGYGRLEDTSYGRQLSDTWLIENAKKSGLKGAELDRFVKDVKAGRVRKIYSFTDPKNGTRFFEVEPVGDRDVKIGKEITHEFKKH
jgi:hypothetical protein